MGSRDLVIENYETSKTGAIDSESVFLTAPVRKELRANQVRMNEIFNSVYSAYSSENVEMASFRDPAVREVEAGAVKAKLHTAIENSAILGGESCLQKILAIWADVVDADDASQAEVLCKMK